MSWYSALSALGDVAGSVGSGLLSYWSTNKYNKDTEAAATRAWERETAYNHPKAQMSRLKEAGLNPAMIYGTGTAGASGNTHASVPNKQAHNLGDVAQRYLTLKSMQLNNDLLIRQGKLLDAQTSNQQVDAAVKLKEAQVYGSTSRDDPTFWYRHYGGRIAKFLRSLGSLNTPTSSAKTAKQMSDEFWNK